MGLLTGQTGSRPADIHRADETAILQRPPGTYQPTVDKVLYSSSWQGSHDGEKPLHPSFQFKHPVTNARIQLFDLENRDRGKLVWDSIFKVNGGHKIAVDQKPVGGTIQKFPGIDSSPSRNGHWYSIRIDADNPSIPDPHSLVRIWRQSEFIFGIKPSKIIHADGVIAVKNTSKFALPTSASRIHTFLALTGGANN
jgi:hypothetical protein